MEETRNKKKERQKGRRNSGGKEERKKEKEKKKSSAGFKLVRLVLLVFLSVEREGVVKGLVSLFYLPKPHSLLSFSLQSSSSGSF